MGGWCVGLWADVVGVGCGVYLWQEGQNIAPPVLLEEEENVHPLFTTGLTRVEEEDDDLGRLEERRPDMTAADASR